MGYPIPVTAEDLYSSGNTRRHVLGARGYFHTDNGPVECVYVRNNNASALSAGLAVGWGSSGYGHADTAAVAAANIRAEVVVGGLAASLAASSLGGYGWVIRHGPQTNAFFGATLASSAGARALAASSNGALTTVLMVGTSNATNAVEGQAPRAILRPNAAIGTTGTAAAAAASVVVDWL